LRWSDSKVAIDEGRTDVNVGDTVEDFSAQDQDGNVVKLSDLLAEAPLVLFFYPKAMTPG